MGYLADRMSVNLELPTAESLKTLAPNKTAGRISWAPMRHDSDQGIDGIRTNLWHTGMQEALFRRGQSTQMIVGATPENDYQIMMVAETSVSQI